MKLYLRCHNRLGLGPEWWYALRTRKNWYWSEHAEDAGTLTKTTADAAVAKLLDVYVMDVSADGLDWKRVSR